jgi:hypothetical protein
VLSGRSLCDELITRPEESCRLWCIVVCDLETSGIGAPYIYIYDISSLKVKQETWDVNICDWVLRKIFVTGYSERYLWLCGWVLRKIFVLRRNEVIY